MPITWKNIAGPNFESGNDLMKAGAESMTGGLDALAKAAQTYGTQQQDERIAVRDNNTQQFLNQIDQMKNMDNYNNQAGQFSQRALSGQNVDASKIMSAYSSQEQDIQDLDTSRFNYNEVLRKRTETPLINQHAAIVAEGNTDAANQFRIDNPIADWAPHTEAARKSMIERRDENRAETEYQLTADEKPILDKYNALIAANDYAGAQKLYMAEQGNVRDWSNALNNAERAQREDTQDEQKQDTIKRKDVTNKAVGKIGAFTNLKDLMDYTGNANYNSSVLKGNGNDIADAVKAQKKYIISTTRAEISLASTIEDDYQKGLYVGFTKKVGGIFDGQMDGDYNDIMRSITDLKQSGEYNAMSPDTRTKINEYVTQLTTKLTNIPAPIQQNITTAMARIPDMKFGTSDNGTKVTFSGQNDIIASEEAANQAMLSKIPDIYKPDRPPMMDGDLPRAITNQLRIAGDTNWSLEDNQEDISKSVTAVKDYLKEQYKGESFPNEVVLEAFKIAYRIDVDSETSQGEYNKDQVLGAVDQAVKNYNRVKSNLAKYDTKTRATAKLRNAYNKKVKDTEGQITKGKTQEYFNALTLKNSN